MAGNETRVIDFILSRLNSLRLKHLGVIQSVKNPSSHGTLRSITSANEGSKEDASKKADVFLNDIGVSIKQSGSSFLFNRLQRANLIELFRFLNLKDETGSFGRLDSVVKAKHAGQITDRDRHWSEIFLEGDFKSLLEFLMMEGSPNKGKSVFPAIYILSAPKNNISDSNIEVYTFDEFFESKKDQIYITIRAQWIGQDSRSEHARAQAIAKKSGNAEWVFSKITGTPTSGWDYSIPESDRREVYMIYIQLIEGRHFNGRS